MPRAIDSIFSEFIRTVRFADVLDVALVALVLYAIIMWMRRAASKRVVIAAALFGGVWALATLLEMYLTKMLIQALLAVIVVAAVVVFQSDIRRAVDRIGSWVLSRGGARPAREMPVLDVLVEASARLAEIKNGALIAIRGREPWDRHIEGGIELGGAISKPLLYSIFSPESPGHDGAVLIDDERITRFGAHLPISANARAIADYGTRHAAALGLSEQCDAAVIVISEERGTISFAQAGKLTACSPAKLKTELERFWRETHASERDAPGGWWRRRELQAAALAIAVAVFAWFLVAYRSETVFRTFVVPIELRNKPPGLSLNEPAPAEARVTLAGSERAFRLLDPAALVVSIDLSRLERGRNELLISGDNLQLPSDVALYQVQPRSLSIDAEELRAVRVPIEIERQADAEAGRDIALQAEPASVTLLIPTTMEEVPTSVRTEPVDPRRIPEGGSVTTRLLLPEGARLAPNQSAEIRVRVQP